ncbi:transcriptional regulator [Bacteroidia bacterium]|nr:transcriptional regulator [Bacteroidia bacterium]
MDNLILLNIGYSELNANWNWKDVYSPFARLYYVKTGKARTYIRDKMYKLEPGYIYLTPPFTLHDDECDGHFALYYIHFYEETVNKESIFDTYNFPVKLQASALDLELIERLQTINPDRYLIDIDPKIYDNAPTFFRYVAGNNKSSYHVQVETRSLLAVLMSHFLEYRVRKSIDKDARINKSLQYIHEHIDRTISIDDLAAIACVSNDHFIRLFKKEMLQTPTKYINAKKIEKAQLLLLTTNSSIRNIAMDLAIDNISYFNRIFKQLTGKTPGQYREENNK